ncbi:MAG: Asp-tRNA(Asn)/Glu-tRNA(Gln) amidotransferase subunit GatB [Candidatus Omnitrophica bacterium]|nr:Asp-tRNA(Asn)/Glu-tRNA(Gln) amidotransferase subunit GatB [Candidatus Omnitrophota bacterium]
MIFETVIGLEVHLQLRTNTKIFCGCANQFGESPNTRTCPVCLGLPGSLPVFNAKALEYALKTGLALNCEINPQFKFDRKNYFYPDLTKAYQISQFDQPVCRQGELIIPGDGGAAKKIRINRAHLEEDAGKLIHDDARNCSLADYNRAGTPLLEIVTEPDLRSSQEAYEYLRILKLTLSYLDVSDCDMEKGSLRCDANVSIRAPGDAKLGTKTELKNMNSFKAVKAAIDYEVNRQRAVILGGQRVVQETRLWDENKAMTFSMRSKEEAHDYRYFPEPDLPLVTVPEEVVEEMRQTLPELPQAKMERFTQTYGISVYDAGVLAQDRLTAGFFEQCAALYPEAKKICNWLNGDVLKEMNERKITVAASTLQPEDLVDLIRKIEEGAVSQLKAKDVLKIMLDSGKNCSAIIAEQGWGQVSNDEELLKIAQQALADNPATVAQIREGKLSAIGFLVGQAMQKSGGKANPKKIKELIEKNLQAGADGKPF